jgi:hypothetical protein
MEDLPVGQSLTARDCLAARLSRRLASLDPIGIVLNCLRSPYPAVSVSGLNTAVYRDWPGVHNEFCMHQPPFVTGANTLTSDGSLPKFSPFPC